MDNGDRMSSPSHHIEPPTTPPAAPAPPSRPGPLRVVLRLARRTLQLLVLLLTSLVLLLIGWLHSNDFQRRAAYLVERLVEEQTGEACTITAVSLQVWPPGANIDGFHLYDDASGETILSLERLRAPLVLRGGGIGLGRLRLQRPVIQLHLDADGKLREFRNLPVREPGQRRPLKRLPWSSLEVVDAAIRLELPEGHVRIEHLHVEPSEGSLGDMRFDLDLRFRDFTDRAHVRWPRVRLGPERIEVPELVLQTAVLDLEGRGGVVLAGDLDAELTGRIRLDQANPLLAPPRAAHGLVDVDLWLRGPPQAPVVEVVAFGQQLGFDTPGVHTPLLTYELGDIAVSAVVQKDGITLEKATVYAGEEGRLSVWGVIDLPDLVLRDSRVVGDRVSLEHLLQAFDAAYTPWVDMSADLEVAWSGTLKPLRLEGDFDMVVADLRVGDRPISDPRVELMLDIPAAYAQGRLTLEKDHVLLEAPRVVGPRNRGSAVIDIGFGPRGPLDLQADLSTADLSDFQPLKGITLTGRGSVSGRISGPFNRLELQGTGDLADFSVMGIPYADRLRAQIVSPDMKRLELHDAVAIRGQTPYAGYYHIDFRDPLRMDTEIAIGRGRIEDLVGMFIDLPGLSGALDEGTLSLHGPLYDLDGEAHLRFGESDLWGERFTHGEAHGYMDEGLFTLDELRVLRDEGREGLLLRGSVEREWKLDMELIGDGLALERLDHLASAEQPLSGNIAVHSRITGTLFDPSPRGRLAVTDVRYAGHPVNDSFVNFQTADGVMAYSGTLVGGATLVDGTLGLWGEQPYALTATLDRLPAHLLHPYGTDGSPIRALASGEVDISGHFGEVWSPVTLRATLPEVEVRYGRHVLRNQAPWRYEQDGTHFALKDFNLRGGATELVLSAISGDTLVLGGQGTVDLDLLRAVVPGLQRISGQADVLLSAVGTKPNVQAIVDITVDADLLRHESVPAAFEDLTAQIRITESRIDLREVHAGLGGGTVVGAGVIDAQEWIPARYDLQATIDDAQIQWVDSLPPAIGDARLRFDGPVDALLLHGQVQVTDMTFSDRIDWEDWIVEYREEMLVDPAVTYDEEPWFSLNVEIGADRTIHLRNNVAEGTASAELRIIGDTARPGLIGSVHVVPGSLAFLQDRLFRIDRGNLLFNDPWSWDPEVDFALVTDIENRDQRYRVNYLVNGPFSDWRTASRSDPPLPQADVNALLWFGVTTEELEETGELSSAVAQGVADLILTDFLISNQAGEFTEELPQFFDRIDLATGVNGRGEYSPEPRLLVEKRLSELGDVDLRWEFNLVRPEDNYVRADKRIGGIWSLSGWYATLQRDRVLPIGGAYGVDVTARWETE